MQTYVAAVDKAVAINQFSVYGQFGLAYQTNANAGPNSPNVLALGQNALLSPQFQKTPDWNAFGLVTVHDFYDFNDQRGDGWESDVIAYYSQQFKVTRLDLGLAELRTGPRIGIGDYGGLSVHPYGIGNVLTLGGVNYLNTVGAGVSLNWPVNETLTITPGVEFRNRWFYNSANYPTAAGQSGGQWIGYVFGSGLVSAAWGLSWQGRVSYTESSASYGPYAFHDFSIDAGLPYSFAAPAFAHTGSLWTITPSAGFSYTPYAIPDPIVSPFVTRTDRQWRVAGTLDTMFYRNIGFTLQVHICAPIRPFRTTAFGFHRRGGADLPLLTFRTLVMRRTRSLPLLFAAIPLGAVLALSAAARADTVGTAGAVNTTSSGTAPGGAHSSDRDRDASGREREDPDHRDRQRPGAVHRQDDPQRRPQLDTGD